MATIKFNTDRALANIQEIWAELVRMGGGTVADLSRLLTMSETQAQHYLNHMAADGIVERTDAPVRAKGRSTKARWAAVDRPADWDAGSEQVIIVRQQWEPIRPAPFPLHEAFFGVRAAA